MLMVNGLPFGRQREGWEWSLYKRSSRAKGVNNLIDNKKGMDSDAQRAEIRDIEKERIVGGCAVAATTGAATTGAAVAAVAAVSPVGLLAVGGYMLWKYWNGNSENKK
jgi:hypothetical protein